MKHPAYALLLLPIPVILFYLYISFQMPSEGISSRDPLTPLRSAGMKVRASEDYTPASLPQYMGEDAATYIENGCLHLAVYSGLLNGSQTVVEVFAMTDARAAKNIRELAGGKHVSDTGFSLVEREFFIRASFSPAVDKNTLSEIRDAFSREHAK